LVVRIAKRREKAVEFGMARLRRLDANEDRTVVGALVSIVEQTDVPVRRHRGQELHEDAGPLRKLEAEQAFAMCERRTPADHVTDVLRRQLIAGQVNSCEAV